jgi:GT2 family glycosyltransferase
MAVSVVIPYHSGALYLDVCVSSLAKDQNEIAEIIIVANGSDSQPNVPKNLDGLIRVLQHSEPLGYPSAVNRGVHEARSSHVVLCDADTFFPQAGWIAKHLDLHARNPKIGITSSKLLNYRTDRILDFGIGRTRFNNFHPCRDAHSSDPRVQASRRVQMACSAVMMIRKDFFVELGGLDESLRYYYQDIDLSLRVKRKQREVWVVADASAYHRGHSSNIVRIPFQIDERAYVTLKHADTFDVDYPNYLAESLTPYLSHLRDAGPFGVVSLSTMIDPSEVLDMVAQHTNLRMLAKWTPPRRDIEFITLPDVVDTQVLRHRKPLLILADRALSLRFNALWKSIRDTTNDFVVDRHANTYLFDQILEA